MENRSHKQPTFFFEFRTPKTYTQLSFVYMNISVFSGCSACSNGGGWCPWAVTGFCTRFSVSSTSCAGLLSRFTSVLSKFLCLAVPWNWVKGYHFEVGMTSLSLSSSLWLVSWWLFYLSHVKLKGVKIVLWSMGKNLNYWLKSEPFFQVCLKFQWLCVMNISHVMPKGL